MTPEMLVRIMPYAGSKATIYAEPLSIAMDRYMINTPRRQAVFLAQVCHESGSLKYTREIASGEEYDVGEKAKRLGNTPEDDNDGERYKGRGLIQITGTANYRDCGVALGLDLLVKPELLEEPTHASMSAGWYWQRKNLNPLADGNKFGEITRLINGGFNGLDDRIAHWLRAREALGVTL